MNIIEGYLYGPNYKNVKLWVIKSRFIYKAEYHGKEKLPSELDELAGEIFHCYNNDTFYFIHIDEKQHLALFPIRKKDIKEYQKMSDIGKHPLKGTDLYSFMVLLT